MFVSIDGGGEAVAQKNRRHNSAHPVTIMPAPRTQYRTTPIQKITGDRALCPQPILTKHVPPPQRKDGLHREKRAADQQ
jgi:hypothetical protein